VDAFDQISAMAADRIPFWFMTDFQATTVRVVPLADLAAHRIRYAMDVPSTRTDRRDAPVVKVPVDLGTYRGMFDQVIAAIRSGHTYLLNLTQPTPLVTDLTLDEIYDRSTGRFRLQVADELVCSSPERFVRIVDGTISTYPMKGTIDAAAPGAAERILADPKEMAEHRMVVDLLRNDLCRVATGVRVDRFRYVEQIRAGDKDLLQVSSQISGDLGPDWRERLGQVLRDLLPAGSITGTPKTSTVQLIRQIEGYDRGFYTGVFGVYDGSALDSAVMIRFVERAGDGLVAKSGGGITIDSDPVSEHAELVDKVYVG
jgi:para-aminobenzoate synthetase component I